MNKNLYWRGPGERHKIKLPACEISFSKWKNPNGIGYDQDSVYALPGFLNVGADDYRLVPGSPAFGLGFVAIDFVNVGATLNPFD